MNWIRSAGGPLLLCNRQNLLDWNGVLDPPEGKTLQATFRWRGGKSKATDYDRAADIDVFMAPIQVGSGLGIVFVEYTEASWISSSTYEGGNIVRWMYADSDEMIPGGLSTILEEKWKPEPFTFEVTSNVCYLFDSAYVGANVLLHLEDNVLGISLPLGLYSVETTVFEPDNRTSFMLHRLTRQAVPVFTTGLFATTT